PGEEDPTAVTISPRVALEVVPPWQLLPVPHNPTSPEDLEGICRRRWVPLSWARERPQLSISTDKEKMKVRQAAYGFRPDADNGLGIQHSTSMPEMEMPFDSGRDRKGRGSKTDTDYVLLEEWFMYRDERDQLASYTVKIGDHIALNEEYRETGVYCP